MNQIILVLIFGILFFGCSKDAPRPQTESAHQATLEIEVPAFNPTRAFDYLTKQTSFGPRNPGSAGHQRCLNYLTKELQALTPSTELQSFTQDGYDGEKLHLTNIFSSINPKAVNRILLVSHWDTRPRADEDKDVSKQNQPILGANDGASGVAILLEIANDLKQSSPPIGVDILLDDGEDYGKQSDQDNYLLGTRYFAKHLKPDYHPSFGILLDMVGDSNLELMKEPLSMRYAPEVVDLVWSTARSLGVYQFTENVQHPVLDDHVPLNEAGIKAIDLIDFAYPDSSNRYWHTTEDTPDKCSPASLQAVGKVLLEIIYHQPS
jgi:glutaminyl-peptide cyclotransferase